MNYFWNACSASFDAVINCQARVISLSVALAPATNCQVCVISLSVTLALATNGKVCVILLQQNARYVWFWPQNRLNQPEKSHIPGNSLQWASLQRRKSHIPPDSMQQPFYKKLGETYFPTRCIVYNIVFPAPWFDWKTGCFLLLDHVHPLLVTDAGS